MSVLANYNYPTIHAQERLGDVMSENMCDGIEVRDIKVHPNGLVTFDANLGGTFERHVLTEDNDIYKYWEYLLHNGMNAVPE